MGALPVSGQLVIRLVEKASGPDRLFPDLHRLDASAAGVDEESTAAEKSVAPLRRINIRDPYGIEASESVLVREQDIHFAPVFFSVENESARLRAAKNRRYDHAVLHHSYARFHAVCGFYLDILAQFTAPLCY